MNSRNSAAAPSRRNGAPAREAHGIKRLGRRAIACSCGGGLRLRGRTDWTKAKIADHLLDWYNRHRLDEVRKTSAKKKT